MVNPIRVVGHVDDEVARRVQRAVVAVTAAVDLGRASDREQDRHEDGEQIAAGSFHWKRDQRSRFFLGGSSRMKAQETSAVCPLS